MSCRTLRIRMRRPNTDRLSWCRKRTCSSAARRIQLSRKKQPTTHQEHLQVRGSAVNRSPRWLLLQLQRKRTTTSDTFQTNDAQTRPKARPTLFYHKSAPTVNHSPFQNPKSKIQNKASYHQGTRTQRKMKKSFVSLCLCGEFLCPSVQIGATPQREML